MKNILILMLLDLMLIAIQSLENAKWLKYYIGLSKT